MMFHNFKKEPAFLQSLDNELKKMYGSTANLFQAKVFPKDKEEPVVMVLKADDASAAVGYCVKTFGREPELLIDIDKLLDLTGDPIAHRNPHVGN